jgi:predicted nucleotidyltransferase
MRVVECKLTNLSESLLMDEFLKSLSLIVDDEALLDFCRKRSLHGTPVVFNGNEDAYYEFRKRISNKFEINFHEVFITGSAKLGFSPHKGKLFDFESDIDIAIISSKLYDKIMSSIHDYQMELRENRKAVSYEELKGYHKFLEYGAIGWMRPDLLPTSFRVHELKRDWFDFFDSISHGKSEVGNYKVTAGAFKSYSHLERYTLSGLRSLNIKLQVGAMNVSADQA